ITAEQENLHTAWRWRVEHIQNQEQAEAVRKALRSLLYFYQMRSRYLEGAAFFASAIPRLEAYAPAGAYGAALAESLTYCGKPGRARQLADTPPGRLWRLCRRLRGRLAHLSSRTVRRLPRALNIPHGQSYAGGRSLA